MQNAQQSVKTPPEVKTRPDAAVFVGLCFWLTPVVVNVVSFVLAPGFIMPFWNNPLVQRILIVDFLVHSFLCGLLCLSGIRRWPLLIKVLLGVIAGISALTGILAPMLGPAVVTIINALKCTSH
jgi:hypothetical protein